MVRIRDSDLILASGILLVFLVFNFDNVLAVSFMAMAFVTRDLRLFDSKKDISIESKPNKVKSLVLAILGYLAVLGISSIFIQGTNALQLNSVVQLMSEALPILAGSVVLTMLVFVFLIPFVESNFFFIGGLDWIKTRMKVGSLSLSNPKAWAVIILISIGFALFHLTAKAGLGAVGFNESLIITFVFALISGILVFVEGQGLAAIIMHVIANGVSMVQKFNIITIVNPLLIGIGLGALAIFLMQRFNINLTRG